jgi:hypothetical protein
MAEINIVLTFDDEPHPSRTEHVLATLDGNAQAKLDTAMPFSSTSTPFLSTRTAPIAAFSRACEP